MPFISDDDAFWRVPEVPAGLLDAPKSGDQEAPGWVHQDVPDVVVPELPEWLLEAPQSNEPPCDCGCCVERVPALVNVHHAPDALADRFAAEWALLQQQTGRMWRAAAAMYAAAGADQAEFVADDLCLITGLHRRSTLPLLLTGVQACQVPDLIALVASGQLSSKHAEALLDEAGKWTEDEAERAAVLQQTLDRCQASVDRIGSWPTPGQLRKRLQTVALLRDLTAAERHKKNVFERRNAGIFPSGIGQATLSIEGPEVAVVQMINCIRARAQALGQLPGDTRSLEQRMFDAASELLTTVTDGGQSAVPTVGDEGELVTIRVRGVEVSVVVPFSVAAGGDLELAEIPGFGPILPSTARELLAQAQHVRRVAVDADTGAVIAVDDRTGGPANQPTPRPPAAAAQPDPIADADLDDPDHDDPDHDDPDHDDPDNDPGGGPDGGPNDEPTGQHGPGLAVAADDPPERDDEVSDPRGLDPAPPLNAATPRETDDATARHDSALSAPTLAPAVLALLRRLATDPVRHRDLRSTSYRVPGRTRRFIEHRDRTCTFPACTVPGRWCDADHREPWPYGETSPENCHCLCRRHHRAKQAYFTVTLDQRTGDTVWTTPDGRTYRRPPPAF